MFQRQVWSPQESNVCVRVRHTHTHTLCWRHVDWWLRGHYAAEQNKRKGEGTRRRERERGPEHIVREEKGPCQEVCLSLFVLRTDRKRIRGQERLSTWKSPHNGSVIWSVWKALLSRLCRRGMSKGVVVGYQVNTKIKKMEQYQSFYSIDLLPYNTWRKRSVSIATLLNSSWSFGTRHFETWGINGMWLIKSFLLLK